MSDRPIFLVGCPRSGTTLLSVMLHAHPRIAMPPETRFLMAVYHQRARFGDLTDPANRRRLARYITRSGGRFSDLDIRRRKVVRDIVAGPPTIGSAAGAVWREFARSRGKARWGEKRPAYWKDLDAVLRLFPDAQVIHLIRDGRSCVASLTQVDWWKSGTIGAMTTWSLAQRELGRVGRGLPAGAYHRLRYEDLLADPHAELTRLCSFLGEDFDAAMLRFSGAAQDIVPDRKTWHVRTRGELDPSRTEAWRGVLEPGDAGLFEHVAGRQLRALGYQLSGVGPRPSRKDVLAYHRLRTRRLARLEQIRFRDLRQRLRERVPLADQVP